MLRKLNNISLKTIETLRLYSTKKRRTRKHHASHAHRLIKVATVNSEEEEEEERADVTRQNAHSEALIIPLSISHELNYQDAMELYKSSNVHVTD